MTNGELQHNMNMLYSQALNTQVKENYKIIIAKAVQLGMQYREEQIKSGIDIVFSEIHTKDS